MKSQLINKSLFEVHKPSGQISSKLTKNGQLHQLTPVQFDTINFMCYSAREQIHKKYNSEDELRKLINEMETDDEVFNFLSNQEFEINLNDISNFTGSYNSNKDKTHLSRSIKELKDITVEMGLFKQHDLSTEESFSLIRRYSRITNSSKIKYRLEPEILVGWVFKTTPFSKLFLKIQTQLKNTYSKILYENCKDYENFGSITKPLKLWNYILGIDSKSSHYVSTLKRDYLNKAMKEINEHTDIHIDKIYGTKKNGEVTMTIEFHNQECELLKQAKDEPELSIEEEIYLNKIRLKSKNKLEGLIQSGYEVKDKDSWIKTDIKKNEKQYATELDLDEYLDELSTEDKRSLYFDLAKYLKLDEPMVMIDNYCIKDFSNKFYTTSAEETIKVLSKILK